MTQQHNDKTSHKLELNHPYIQKVPSFRFRKKNQSLQIRKTNLMESGNSTLLELRLQIEIMQSCEKKKKIKNQNHQILKPNTHI